MKQYAEKMNLSFQQFADEDGSVIKQFRVTSYPTYFVLGRDGLIKLVAGGGDVTFPTIEQTIREELKK